jgi:hypothetical protein
MEHSLKPRKRGRGFLCISKGDTPRGSLHVVLEMKVRRAAKIRELGHALVDAGFLTLDEQSKTLGFARSTTRTILRASHGGSGLSTAIITRMLLSPQLPPLAQRKILEYTTDKLAGVLWRQQTRSMKYLGTGELRSHRRRKCIKSVAR